MRSSPGSTYQVLEPQATPRPGSGDFMFTGSLRRLHAVLALAFRPRRGMILHPHRRRRHCDSAIIVIKLLFRLGARRVSTTRWLSAFGHLMALRLAGQAHLILSLHIAEAMNNIQPWHHPPAAGGAEMAALSGPAGSKTSVKSSSADDASFRDQRGGLDQPSPAAWRWLSQPHLRDGTSGADPSRVTVGRHHGHQAHASCARRAAGRGQGISGRYSR